MSWETVIGLEIHVQLSTKSKLFSGGSTEFGAESNTHVDLVDMDCLSNSLEAEFVTTNILKN